jgi:SAM-dependent methyltransferase
MIFAPYNALKPMSDFWNERYDTPDYVYGKEANTWFKDFFKVLKPGKLLLPGEGEGRNAVWAASSGWEVTAVDTSEVARAKALALAAGSDISLSYHIGDVIRFIEEAEPGSFDAIAMVFLHLPPSERMRFHSGLARLLRPGGLVYLLAFGKDQANRSTGGPRNPDMLYDQAGLRQDFRDLRILFCRDFTGEFEEGSFHSGEFDGIELAATK